jgi:hypothetical protein
MFELAFVISEQLGIFLTLTLVLRLIPLVICCKLKDFSRPDFFCSFEQFSGSSTLKEETWGSFWFPIIFAPDGMRLPVIA